MARTATTANRTATTKTKPVVKDVKAAAVEKSATAVVDSTDEDMNKTETVVKAAPVVKEVKVEEKPKQESKVAEEALKDSDEIEVTALIPNVSYKDDYTSDFYRWDESGHTEFMKFETINRMWRKYKGYFKNMWLKPNDDRVIKKFGLSNTYEKYDFLMDGENYVKDNINDIVEGVSSCPREMKSSIVNKIKDLIISGSLTDIFVIRTLETKFGLDLIDLI